MAFYNRQNFCEDDRMSYSEQSYARPGNFVRPHHNNNRVQMTECDTYTTTGYGSQGGYLAPVPAYNSGACFERKEEVCMSNSHSGGRRMNPFGHRRRRVMRWGNGATDGSKIQEQIELISYMCGLFLK
ncbi:hypothetical protein V2J09_020204 [Rumex salicifolius]